MYAPLNDMSFRNSRSQTQSQSQAQARYRGQRSSSFDGSVETVSSIPSIPSIQGVRTPGPGRIR